MKLTIAVEPDVLKRARIRAIEDGTSVSAIVRDHLAAYAEGWCSPQRRPAGDSAQGRTDAIGRLIQLSKTRRPAATSPRTTRDERGNRTWKRDDLYER